MSDESVILINLLKVKPGQQDALIALLQRTVRASPSTPSGRALQPWRRCAAIPV